MKTRFLCILVSSLLLCGAGAPEKEQPTTLAVLNFVNRNPGDGWDWLGTGLADMLITDLSSSERLQVVGREEMQQLFDEMRLGAAEVVDPGTAQSFGRVLAADLVLTGSFLREDDALEIEAHIVTVRTGELRRVEWVRGAAADVLKLEKELALKIVHNLGVKLTDAEIESLRRLPTSSVDAATHFYNGTGLYDEGRYEDALAQFRLAAAKDNAYAQAAHWRARMYHQAGDYEHAACEYKRCILQTTDQRWGGESAFNLGLLYEMNLGETYLAIGAYTTLTRRFPRSKRTADAWRRIGGLLMREEDWLGAHRAMEHTGSDDLRTRVYLYAKVLETQGDVVEPPEFVTTLDPKNPRIVKRDLPAQALRVRRRYHYFKAPNGYQINRIDLELRGRLNEPERGGKKKNAGVSLSVWDFPQTQHYYGTLTVDAMTDTTSNKSITCLPGTRIVSLRLVDAWSRADYWQADFHMGPFDKSAPVRAIKPSLPKVRIRATESSVVVPVARCGGFSPCVVEDIQGRLWAVFNDVGEFGLYSAQLTGEVAGIWLMSSWDGKHWTRPDFLAVNSAAAPDYSASLMAAEDGKLWLTWVSGRGFDGKHKIWISSSYDGKRWARPRKVAVGQHWDMLGFPRLIQDTEGVFWLIYGASNFGHFEHYMKRPGEFITVNGFRQVLITSSRNTVDWSEPKLVTDCDMVRDIWAMQDRLGVFRVVVGRRHEGLTVLSSRNGCEWSGAEYDPGFTCIFPCLIQDSDGSYVLVHGGQNRGTVASLSKDCKSWNPLGRISSTGIQNETSCLARRAGGGYCLITGSYGPIRRDICVEFIPELPGK